jgi:SAM-dependent methyltransferase
MSRPGRSDLRDVFASYPRSRPPLSDAHAAVYAEQYRINRDGETLVDGAAQRLEQWMHRRIARVQGAPVLELGGGTLNHLKFEPSSSPYDVVEPFKELYLGRPEAARVRTFFDDASEIPVENRYKRIVSVAVLEHLPNLPHDLARSAQLLEGDGVFQAGIPSEGGLLWWLGWRLGTGVGYYLRTGLDYGVVMRHEHLNDAKTILKVVRHFFADVRVARFPTPFHQLSFYAYVEGRSPIAENANRYLAEYPRKPAP